MDEEPRVGVGWAEVGASLMLKVGSEVAVSAALGLAEFVRVDQTLVVGNRYVLVVLKKFVVVLVAVVLVAGVLDSGGVEYARVVLKVEVADVVLMLGRSEDAVVTNSGAKLLAYWPTVIVVFE